MTDRRVPFFFLSATVCALLAPVADPQHRWVPIAASVTYTVLAVLFALDARSRSRPKDRRRNVGS